MCCKKIKNYTKRHSSNKVFVFLCNEQMVPLFNGVLTSSKMSDKNFRIQKMQNMYYWCNIKKNNSFVTVTKMFLYRRHWTFLKYHIPKPSLDSIAFFNQDCVFSLFETSQETFMGFLDHSVLVEKLRTHLFSVKFCSSIYIICNRLTLNDPKESITQAVKWFFIVHNFASFNSRLLHFNLNYSFCANYYFQNRLLIARVIVIAKSLNSSTDCT